jgi:hypothetical protein
MYECVLVQGVLEHIGRVVTGGIFNGFCPLSGAEPVHILGSVCAILVATIEINGAIVPKVQALPPNVRASQTSTPWP